MTQSRVQCEQIRQKNCIGQIKCSSLFTREPKSGPNFISLANCVHIYLLLGEFFSDLGEIFQTTLTGSLMPVPLMVWSKITGDLG